MPFFDDSGPRPEEEHGPIGRSFALVKDQLERLVLLNILWALQCVPLMVGWAFEMPLPLRIGLTLYTAFALVPATGTLFAVVAEVSESIPLDKDVILNSLKEQFKPSLLKLLPLLSLFGLLVLAVTFFDGQGWLIPDTLARLLILLLVVVSLYWGPLLIYKPELSALGILRRSIQLVLKVPSRTIMTGLVCLLAIILGAISIIGFVAIVPVLVALFQVQLYRFLRKG